MLTELYIEALLVDEELADRVWWLWARGGVSRITKQRLRGGFPLWHPSRAIYPDRYVSPGTHLYRGENWSRFPHCHSKDDRYRGIE